MEGAAKDRLTINDDWDVIGHARGVLALAAREQTLRRALEEVAEAQPATLENLRSNGVVFDGPLGNDPKNWQHVAFSIYTDLCEVDSIARAALDALAADAPAPEETAIAWYVVKDHGGGDLDYWAFDTEDEARAHHFAKDDRAVVIGIPAPEETQT